jgi:UDP-2-acetamido-2-deoxy-ribo-hexuluronate aminotransferase
MPVPFIDLSRLTKEISTDVLADWKGCLERCEFVGGPSVLAMEQKLKTILGVPHALSCANGTDALIIALQLAGIKRGSKVALPNLTFWATYEAVAQLGATAVLVDIDPDDLQMSFDELKKAHEVHHFEAALIPHLYGWASARLADFRTFAKDKGFTLVEDGAQCFGVRVNGEPILAKATIGTLSFYPAKVIGGAMDGGAITMQTEAHEKLARSLCNHGRADHYSYAHVGWNSRMGGMQGAFLSRMLDKTEAILASRKNAAALYRKKLGAATTSKKIRVYGPPAGVEENGYLNAITVEGMKGQDIVDKLKAAGIGAARTYPEPMSIQPPAKDAIRFGELARSTAFCERVVNLPLFYGIREDEVDAAVAALLTAIG